ncbi:MAG: dihydroorotate dehydrogenase [Ardenticatenales bacterium]|nr:dihydroorotate dehydrogenase [Ardenticatenales bacterium]
MLQTTLAGVTLPTPLVLASGIIGTSATLLTRAAALGAGAVTAKSAGPELRKGHRNPICFDWGEGLINAVGLPNPGATHEADLLAAAKQALAPSRVALIASIFAGTPEQFAAVAQIVLQANPDILELNISCPNVHDDFGEPFAASCAGAASVAAAVKPLCRAAGVPMFIKLAPNVPNIGRIAADAVAAGADGITAINTMPGMVIDIESARPILTNRSGGLSGPMLRPIAVRCVYEIAEAVPGTPIIGTGGVTSGADAIEMLMAGATAVGVGSAIYYRGLEAMQQISEEMTLWLQSHGVASLDDIRGMAHR